MNRFIPILAAGAIAAALTFVPTLPGNAFAQSKTYFDTTTPDRYEKAMSLLAVTASMLTYGPGTSNDGLWHVKRSRNAIQGSVTALDMGNRLLTLLDVDGGSPHYYVRIVDQNKDELRAVIFSFERVVVVAFRGSCGPREGTNKSPNWKMNLERANSDPGIEWFHGHAVHSGWGRALNLFYDEVSQQTKLALGNHRAPALRDHVLAKSLVITGHSMGGAMAYYFSYRFFDANKSWVPAPINGIKGRYVRTRVITFGAPRAGYVGGLPNHYRNLRNELGVWAGAYESDKDQVPGTTLGESLGNRIQFGSSMGDDAHDIRNYYLKVARDYRTAYGFTSDNDLPYSNMNDPYLSWKTKVRLPEPY